LRWYIDDFVKQNGIHVELKLASEIGRLPGAVETDLFASLKKGFRVIVTHPGAPRDRSFGKRPDLVILQIEDFGRGMPASSIDALSGGNEKIGMGVLCMRERLQQIGGRLEIRSSDKGTAVVASVPLSV
jgi:signal transduction histidine kinase